MQGPSAVQCLWPAYNSINSWIIVLVWFCGLGINGWVPTHYLARYDATHQDILHHFKLRPLCLYSLLHLWAIMHCTLLRICRSPVNIITTISNDKGLSSGKLLHAMKESNVDRTEVSVCTYYMCVPLNLLHVPLIWLADSMLLYYYLLMQLVLCGYDRIHAHTHRHHKPCAHALCHATK